MEKMVREPEDLKNSQISVLKKISRIKADNIHLSNKTLEEGLTDIFDKIDQNRSMVSALYDEFLAETGAFKKQHKLDQLPGLD